MALNRRPTRDARRVSPTVAVVFDPSPSQVVPVQLVSITSGWGWPQTVAVIVPVIAALGAIVIWALTQRANRAERRRRAFADALAAVEAYVELPYRVRRRRDSAEARHNLTEAISQVQSDIARHVAWLELEAPTVAEPYRTLVRIARSQAGAQMQQAWRNEPLRNDSDMNLHIAYPREQVDAARTSCLAAMAEALRLWRSR